MARFSFDLHDKIEAANALQALSQVPETQLSSVDSEVTFRKVIGSGEVLATRPGVDLLEVMRPMDKFI